MGKHTDRDCRVGFPNNTPPVGRVAPLRQRFNSESLSTEASKHLLVSWQTKSSKSYDSMFQRWISWCTEGDSDPISGPVTEVSKFLADLFGKGYQQRSINAYHSAITSAHDGVNGVSMSQYPTISTYSRNSQCQPPQSHYKSTWDVGKVLEYKIVTFVPEGPDLHGLEITNLWCIPEGIVFFTNQTSQTDKKRELLKISSSLGLKKTNYYMYAQWKLKRQSLFAILVDQYLLNCLWHVSSPITQ